MFLASARRRRAYLSIEAILVVALIALAAPYLISMQRREAEDIADKSIAQQMVVFKRGVETFTLANRTALLTEIGATGATSRTAAQITASGAVNASFPGVNIFNQNYVALYYSSSPGRVDSLACAVGVSGLNETRLASIATKLGAEGGGYVSRRATTRVRGLQGGYDVPVATFAPTGISIPAGSLCASSFYSAAAGLTNYLYRFNIGDPEANTMHTAINMGGQRINNALDVGLTATGSTGRTLAQAVQRTVVGPDGTVVQKPNCPAGTTPFITTSVMNASKSAAGEVISGIVSGADNNGASWTLRLQVAGPTGQMAPAAPFGLVSASIRCE